MSHILSGTSPRHPVRGALAALLAAFALTGPLAAAPIVTEAELGVERMAPRVQPRHEDTGSGLEAREWSPSRMVQQHGSPAALIEAGSGSAAYVDRPGLPPEMLASTAWTVDDAYARRNPTLAELMREFGSPLDPGVALAPARGQGRGAGAPAPMWETLNGVLRLARDAMLDENDAATFSLAGVELSLSLRGDRRSLTLNGQDVLPALLSGGQGPETLRAIPSPAAYSRDITVLPLGADHGAAPEPSVLLARLREIVFQPLALLGVVGILALWIFLRVIHSARSKQSW